MRESTYSGLGYAVGKGMECMLLSPSSVDRRKCFYLMSYIYIPPKIGYRDCAVVLIISLPDMVVVVCSSVESQGLTRSSRSVKAVSGWATLKVQHIPLPIIVNPRSH